MNYIYDVILNFNDNYYEVFEWKNTDNIINVRKIPFIKVSDSDFISLKNNIIKLDKENLDEIIDEFNVFDYNLSDNIIFLASSNTASIALMFDNDGNLIKRSAMVFDEEDEGDLEKSINTFLNSEDIDVIDIKFQTTMFISGEDQIYCFSAMIIYN